MSILLANGFICTGLGFEANGSVLIEDGRIRWIGPARDCPNVPLGCTERDMSGRIVIPGLINTHAHGGLGLHRGCCDDGDLFEWAETIAPWTSKMTLDDIRNGCTLGVIEMLRNGITTVCDCTRYGAGIFSAVARSFGLRSLSGALANSPTLRKAGRANWPDALKETDAAMEQNAGNGLCRYYVGAHSPYSCTPELIVEVKAAARERDLPFVIHLAENRLETEIVRERHGLTPLRHLHSLGALDKKTLLAHCIWIDDEELQLLALSGASVSHNPVSNAKLASGVARVPDMRRAGVNVGLGTDSTISNNCLDLFQEMKSSILLQRAATLNAHALSAYDAFAMATLEGARTLGWDKDIGSLDVGKSADLVILDLEHPLGLSPQRVMSDIVYRAGPQHVKMVMVAGEPILDDGRFVRFDEYAVKREIQEFYANI